MQHSRDVFVCAEPGPIWCLLALRYAAAHTYVADVSCNHAGLGRMEALCTPCCSIHALLAQTGVSACVSVLADDRCMRRAKQRCHRLPFCSHLTSKKCSRCALLSIVGWPLMRLQSPTGFQYFHAHLQAEFSEENILCWKAIKSWLKRPSHSQFQNVFVKFVTPNAPLQVACVAVCVLMLCRSTCPQRWLIAPLR